MDSTYNQSNKAMMSKLDKDKKNKGDRMTWIKTMTGAMKKMSNELSQVDRTCIGPNDNVRWQPSIDFGYNMDGQAYEIIEECPGRNGKPFIGLSNYESGETLGSAGTGKTMTPLYQDMIPATIYGNNMEMKSGSMEARNIRMSDSMRHEYPSQDMMKKWMMNINSETMRLDKTDHGLTMNMGLGQYGTGKALMPKHREEMNPGDMKKEKNDTMSKDRKFESGMNNMKTRNFEPGNTAFGSFETMIPNQSMMKNRMSNENMNSLIDGSKYHNEPKTMANIGFRDLHSNEAIVSTMLESRTPSSLSTSAHKTDIDIEGGMNLIVGHGRPKVELDARRPESNMTFKHMKEGLSKIEAETHAQNNGIMTGQNYGYDDTKYKKYTNNDERMTGPVSQKHVIENHASMNNKDNSLNAEATKDDTKMNEFKVTGNKHDKTELRKPEVYIPPMPEPDELRKEHVPNDGVEYGKLNDLINRYEATFIARRNIYMLVLSVRNKEGDGQFYSTGIDHLKETNEELIKLYRKIQGFAKKLETAHEDSYIEMPNFGSTDLVDMKVLQSLPKYDPARNDITLHQFWLKITQFINLSKTSEEATKCILIYLLEGSALDTFEMNKEKSIKEIIKMLNENFGGMPTKMEYEEQMNKFSRRPDESIRSAMNRFEYIIKKLYMNEKDMEQIVEMRCKETVKQIAGFEAKERLERAEMEARANGAELNFKDRLNIIAMEEDIIAKRKPTSHEASFMQMIKHEHGYYHPRKLMSYDEKSTLEERYENDHKAMSEAQVSNIPAPPTKKTGSTDNYYDYAEDDFDEHNYSEDEASDDEVEKYEHESEQGNVDV